MFKKFPTADEQKKEAMTLFRSTFGIDEAAIHNIFLPYRICPLGAHVDHQGGQVMGRSVSTGTVLVYTPLPDAEIRLASLKFPNVISFKMGDRVQHDHWGRYAQAAALALGEKHPLKRGFVGVTNGTLVSAGLSSSASVGLAYLQAIAETNNITLSKDELMELDFQLERTYLGLDNGILDPGSILYSQDNTMVYINTRNREIQEFPDPPGANVVGWLIVTSGVTRELTSGSEFNQRVSECRASAQWLDPTAIILSDIPAEKFAERAKEMPEPLRRRATHYFGEVERVANGVEAWRYGDFTRFGSLMNESCSSSIHQYQCGQEEIVALQQIVREAPGVYGSRFSGGGYGGCVVGLVNRAQAPKAAEQIIGQYRKKFPTQAVKTAVYLDCSL